MARFRKTGDWKGAEKRLKQLEKLIASNLESAIDHSAEKLVKDMQNKIGRGDDDWKPLSPLTIERKGSSRPLEDTKALKRSIVFKKFPRRQYFIGVPRNSKRDDGVSLYTIAVTQEFGSIIKPKEAGALAVPLNQEAKELQIRYGGTRSIPGLFRLKGKKVLVMKDGGGLRPMFILMEKATVPPRSFMMSTYNKSKKKIERRLEKAVKLATKGEVYPPW